MSNNNNTQLAAPVAQGQYSSMLTAFESFPQMMQVADALAHSSIVPQRFQNDPGSVMIALDMAARSNLNPLMVMQNLYTVYGTPSFSGKFALTLLRRSGLFGRLGFEYREEGNWEAGVRLVAVSLDGETTEYGPWIDKPLALAMGWFSKKDSMWCKMGDQMARYRATSWFCNTNCPEVLMGLPTKEEVEEAPEMIRNVTTSGEATATRTKSAMKPSKPAMKPSLPAAAPAADAAPAEEQMGKVVDAEVVDATQQADAPAEGYADGDEEQQEQAALVWLNGAVKGSGATWKKVYKVMEALGFNHPDVGAARPELARFSLWVFRTPEAREALEQSGFVFEK